MLTSCPQPLPLLLLAACCCSTTYVSTTSGCGVNLHTDRQLNQMGRCARQARTILCFTLHSLVRSQFALHSLVRTSYTSWTGEQLARPCSEKDSSITAQHSSYQCATSS